MDYYPSATAPPGYLGISLFGNNIGVLSRIQPPDTRRGQLVFWKGSLDDYEGAFYYPRSDAHPPAEGIVDFAFVPGQRYRLRLEVREKGERFVFRVNDQTVLDRKIGEPRRDRTLEIRSWYPAQFDDLSIEGCLKKQ